MICVSENGCATHSRLGTTTVYNIPHLSPLKLVLPIVQQLLECSGVHALLPSWKFDETSMHVLQQTDMSVQG